MAASKEYAYFLKGNKLAIVQKDFNFGDGLYYEDDGINDIGSQGGYLWKSPIESITDGLEIEYVYSPEWIYTDEDASISLTAEGDSYDNDGGFLKLVDASGGFGSSITHIVIRNSSKWNGLHKVKTYTDSSNITLETRYSGSEEAKPGLVIKTGILALTDESFDLDITRYQATQLVNYVKAKYAEDKGEIELKEYYMKEFRRGVEKHESGKKIGPYRTQGYNLFR